MLQFTYIVGYTSCGPTYIESFLTIFGQCINVLNYKEDYIDNVINESQTPSRPTWPRPFPVVMSRALLSRIFLHRKSGILISRLYLIPIYLFIYFRYFDIFPGLFLTIMLAYCSMLIPHYYAQNYAGIMWTTLPTGRSKHCIVRQDRLLLRVPGTDDVKQKEQKQETKSVNRLHFGGDLNIP